MSSPPPRSRASAPAGRAASFAQAAARLDEAATKLSAAAQAMSSAAEIFASIAPNFKLAPVATPVPVGIEQPTQTLAPDRDISGGHITEEECTNPEDSDYWLSDQEEHAYADSKGDHTNQSSRHISNLIPSGPDITVDPQRDLNSPAPVLAPRTIPTELYRILVDQEGDVLPTICSVMQHYKRMICYMACGLNVVAVYKDLIESVTGTTVYTVTKSSASHTNSVASKFFKHENSVLMLPDTISPDGQFSTSADLCVIHVDWPSDEARYKKQISIHRARTNILVAFSEDSNLYPCSSNILLETTPWPIHEKPIQPTNALRRLFDQKLSDISAERKENVYMDWISCHGPSGSRYVESWDAIGLVHRANLYILDVLRYKSAGSASHNADLQVALPRVSPGFVIHNKLESAVEDGILHVRSGPNSKNPFSTPRDEMLSRGATSLNELGHSGRSNFIPPPDSWSGASYANMSEHSTPKPDTPELPDYILGSAVGYHTLPTHAFESVPGLRYITIEEEFDAIPLICFLANFHGRLVWFLDDGAAMVHYCSLLSSIVSHKIYYPKMTKDPDEVENSARNFISQSSPAILLMLANKKNHSSVLTGTFIECAVYWGPQLPLSQAMKHYKKMKCGSAYIIMTTARRDQQLEKGPMEIEIHLSSEFFCSQDKNSLLGPMRGSTKSVLLSKNRLVQQMYRCRIIFFCENSSPSHECRTSSRKGKRLLGTNFAARQ
ncbi:hypothetical protein FRC08_012052 [Ceratobasidium sp. 394]|nr:hypothetical protein FRC08_012052 [Ceratobasidium sp. 394]